MGKFTNSHLIVLTALAALIIILVLHINARNTTTPTSSNIPISTAISADLKPIITPITAPIKNAITPIVAVIKPAIIPAVAPITKITATIKTDNSVIVQQILPTIYVDCYGRKFGVPRIGTLYQYSKDNIFRAVDADFINRYGTDVQTSTVDDRQGLRTLDSKTISQLPASVKTCSFAHAKNAVPGNIYSFFSSPNGTPGSKRADTSFYRFQAMNQKLSNIVTNDITINADSIDQLSQQLQSIGTYSQRLQTETNQVSIDESLLNKNTSTKVR